ncbi:hypothetical protein VFPPC_17007 [Pochonia chlamydosporia 170]|uniref:Uncharacterized protein n=1 Tax=Pochonia chlamydosporia 170 TaxID=1380566 RepID=A0A179EYJ7_METCM|nr:hypothetical protein VFPPC_17007 [Pochonia chlamydosporia 170]OAQ58275.1 hypothetical protein VFPPC_17007 [Pochonia chlamydosporia 170]
MALMHVRRCAVPSKMAVFNGGQILPPRKCCVNQMRLIILSGRRYTKWLARKAMVRNWLFTHNRSGTLTRGPLYNRQAPVGKTVTPVRGKDWGLGRASTRYSRGIRGIHVGHFSSSYLSRARWGKSGLSRCLIADGDIEVHVPSIARVRWPILPSMC